MLKKQSDPHEKKQELIITKITLENLFSSLKSSFLGVELLKNELNNVSKQNNDQIKHIESIISSGSSYDPKELPVLDDLKLKELLSMQTTFTRCMVKEYIPESEQNEIDDLKLKLKKANEDNIRLKNEKASNISSSDISSFLSLFNNDLDNHLQKYGINKFIEISISQYGLNIKLNHMKFQIDNNCKYLNQSEIKEQINKNEIRIKQLKESFDLNIEEDNYQLIFNQKNINKLIEIFNEFNTEFTLVESSTNRFNDSVNINVINSLHFSLSLNSIDFSNRFYFN